MKPNIEYTESKGHTVKQCPGTSHDYLCCGYHVINHVEGCPIDCTYCILQFYLDAGKTVIHSDTENIITEIEEKIATQPHRFFRIGTGELSDSLVYDNTTNFSSQLIELFRDIPNAMLELKTKTNNIRNLIGLNHGEKTVISWSVNPPAIIAKEERNSATLDERLEAIKIIQNEGYLLGLHFDPMLDFPGWQTDYPELVNRLFSVIRPERVAWISIGSLRFPPEMKEKVLEKFPESKIMYGELVRGMDGKMRYLKPMRIAMYQILYEALRRIDKKMFIYFCMESPEIWERIMRWTPKSNEHLDFLFAKSLNERFPGLIHEKPQQNFYNSGIPLHKNTE
ncbi:MAG: hypothetical protein ISS00_02430 [Candidatus Marinimicrobia bacterium]|nr:hypothetical protein [Candidatus Neomarinimicrobiota bacterium]